jgi:putative peptidoglycan lipid II flippase
MGYLAAALGTTLAAWANLVLLWRGTRHMDGAATIDTRLAKAAPRILLASLLMGAVIWACAWVMSGYLSAGVIRYLALAVLILIGGLVYGASVIGLGGVQPAQLKAAFKRSGKG